MVVWKARAKRGRVLGLALSLAAAAVLAVFIPMMDWTHAIWGVDRGLLNTAESRGRTASTQAVALAPRVHRPATGLGTLPAGMVLGYFYDPSGTPSALSMLKRYLPVLTGIIPFWYTIESNGSITGSTDPAVLKVAEQHKLWTFALVENMAGQPVFGPLLNSAVSRQRAIENMLTLVESNGYNGVNLDWEGIASSERTQFSSFVQQLANTFHRHGYYVTLSIPAETQNQPQNSWTGAYNYRALGRSADLLMIMAYDQHYAGGQPGPIASAAWVKRVLDYTISAVKPSKVVLGIPGYGYDWSGNGPAAALTYSQAESLASQYGKSGKSNHFVYMQNGQLHSVWFENTASLLANTNLVSGYELRGIALWRLGIEDPKIWDFLQ